MVNKEQLQARKELLATLMVVLDAPLPKPYGSLTETMAETLYNLAIACREYLQAERALDTEGLDFHTHIATMVARLVEETAERYNLATMQVLQGISSHLLGQACEIGLAIGDFDGPQQPFRAARSSRCNYCHNRKPLDATGLCEACKPVACEECNGIDCPVCDWTGRKPEAKPEPTTTEPEPTTAEIGRCEVCNQPAQLLKGGCKACWLKTLAEIDSRTADRDLREPEKVRRVIEAADKAGMSGGKSAEQVANELGLSPAELLWMLRLGRDLHPLVLHHWQATLAPMTVEQMKPLLKLTHAEQLQQYRRWVQG